MTILVPAGAPPWTRAATFTDYGGHASKQNYLDRGPIDQLTDVGAASFARMTNDMAALIRTAPFCVISFGQLVDGVRYVTDCRMMTGVRTVPYAVSAAPPLGFPRVDRNGIGDYTITLLAEYTDSYGVTAPFSIQQVRPGNAVHSSVCRVVAHIESATTVRVRVFDASDAAIDAMAITGLAIY